MPGLLTDGDFVAQRGAALYRFTLPASFFDQPTLKLKNPRLRGLEACVWIDPPSKPLDFVRLRLDLPDQSIRTPTQTVWANTPSINLPIVTYPQNGDFTFEARNEVHNASPIGQWTLQMDKRSISDKPFDKDEVLRNIFLVMKLSSEV